MTVERFLAKSRLREELATEKHSQESILKAKTIFGYNPELDAEKGFQLSNHAEKVIVERNIKKNWIVDTFTNPDNIENDKKY